MTALTIDRLYDLLTMGGPIFESNFRGMLRLLMGGRPRKGFVPTVMDFPACYLNREFRDWLKETMADKQAIDFVKEMDRTTGSENCSIANVDGFVKSPISALQRFPRNFTYD